jgi:predicted sulfurtransferase
MKMKKMIACFLASLGLNAACAQASYENADVKGFMELINYTNVVVLDVRTVDEFKEGHIEGAVNIDQAQSDFTEKVKAAIFSLLTDCASTLLAIRKTFLKCRISRILTSPSCHAISLIR